MGGMPTRLNEAIANAAIVHGIFLASPGQLADIGLVRRTRKSIRRRRTT